MASRVAAQLNEDNNVEAETVKGRLGEFSVYINGQKVIETNRLWYPVPSKVVKKVRQLIAEIAFGELAAILALLPLSFSVFITFRKIIHLGASGFSPTIQHRKRGSG